MKILLFAFIFLFLACSDSPKSTNLSQDFERILSQVQEKQQPQAPQELVDTAKSLIDRSESYGYKLINTQELHSMLLKEQVILIDTSLKGQYLLEHLVGAKHFAFNSSSLTTQGELKWQDKKHSQQEFQSKLGENLLAPIVFYTHQASIDLKADSADIGCMWAKKMGYHNVYRLIGGLESWKAKKFPITNEVPKCCQ